MPQERGGGGVMFAVSALRPPFTVGGEVVVVQTVAVQALNSEDVGDVEGRKGETWMAARV